MIKSFDKYADVLAKHMGSLLGNRYINVLKDGLVINLVPSLIGSFFLLIVAAPIPGYTDFMASILGESWSKYPLLIVGASLDMMGIIGVLSISYRLAESFKIPSFPAAISAFMCYLLMTPQFVTHNSEVVSGVIPTMYMGSRGLFTAIIIGIVGTKIYNFFIQKKIVITLPGGVPPAVANSFIAVIPTFFSLLFFLIVRYLVDISSYENIHLLVIEVIITPLSAVGTSFWGFIFYVILLHILWFFGIHGGLVVSTLYGPLFLIITDQNRMAFQAGEALPNLFTIGSFNAYVFLGGSGGSLAIIIAMIFFAKSKLYKSVAKLSLLPGLFNINEPFVFGMPIVMNLRLFIPWILVPIVNFLVAYFATVLQLVPRHPGITIPWTTPIIISGFLVGGIQGVLLQLCNLTISAMIWYVFFISLDREQVKIESIE